MALWPFVKYREIVHHQCCQLWWQNDFQDQFQLLNCLQSRQSFCHWNILVGNTDLHHHLLFNSTPVVLPTKSIESIHKPLYVNERDCTFSPKKLDYVLVLYRQSSSFNFDASPSQRGWIVTRHMWMSLKW